MTSDDVIAGLLEREGGWRDQVTRPDGSIDPDTNLGITLPTLRTNAHLLGLDPATITVQTLRELTPAQARVIYIYAFVITPGFTREAIPYEPLRVQLIDFGVNSGPERAIRWLQRVLGYVEVDGKLGPRTLDRLHEVAGQWIGLDATRYRLVNDALVAARSYMIDVAVDQGSMRKQDEEGVESRALSFFLARP